jgi:TetR/AcrR family fatty acid metabolism transcriptional regulator
MNKKTKEEVLEEFRCTSIQDAAMAIIARKGVAEATMQEIADEAGVAKGTLYVYFRDRDELLAKTAARAYDKLVADLETAMNADGSLAERLTRMVLRQLAFFDEHRALFSAYIALGAGMKKQKESSYQRYLQQVESLFAEAQQRGELRDVEAHEVAAVYADLVRGVIVRRIEEKSKSPREQQAAFIVSLLLRGIAGEASNET